jgi:hypothetical protein
LAYRLERDRALEADVVRTSADSSNDSNGLAQRVARLEYSQQITEAKLEITEKQSEYGLLFNGDRPNGRDRAKWGKEIFTGDGPFWRTTPTTS